VQSADFYWHLHSVDYSHIDHTHPMVSRVNKMAEAVTTKGKRHFKYEQKYRVEHRDEFKCINKSSLGDTFTFCNLCHCDVYTAHSGRDDFKKTLRYSNFSLILSFYCAIC